MATKLKSKTGYSLIELLIGMVVLGIVLTAVYSLFISAGRVHRAQDMEVEMQQNARAAADFIVRELRNKNALSCLENTTTPCATTGDKISFSSMTDSDTRIFSWSSSDQVLRFSKASSGAPDRQPLADNITGLTLSPLDQNNNSTTNLAGVYRIDITINVRSATVDPSTNNYHTFGFKTSVMKRN